MKRSLATRIVVGLFIIAAGVLVIGNVAFGWKIGNLATSWWTLFIIVPALVGIISTGLRFWNIFLLLIGAWLLAEDQKWLGNNAWPYFLGAFLLLLGIYVVTGGSRCHHHHDHDHNHDGYVKSRGVNEDTNDYPDYSIVFSTVRCVNKSRNFRGGKASSIFSSMTVDLREIGITGNAYFEVASVFGGLEILVPRGMPLRLDITPVFGGFSNQAVTAAPAGGQPCLEIKGAAVFGNIRIL